jgi:hypothetical protein
MILHHPVTGVVRRACVGMLACMSVFQASAVSALAGPPAFAADATTVTAGIGNDRGDPSRVPVVRQSRGDAWWTGPMLANSAETLPKGHFLIETYLYDVATAHADGFGSRTYMLYGLADRFTVGMIPIIGYNRVSAGPDSSGIGLGDIEVMAQYRLTEFREGSAWPTFAVQLQQAFPTGKYDRLGNRPSDGMGSGAYATTLALLSQTWFWLPNGRILRARFNLSQTFSGSADVQGVSVYGTDDGFRGRAKPGRAFLADASLEYSLTRNWVLALDLFYSHNRNVRVTGRETDADGTAGGKLMVRDIGSTAAFGFAPAVEYSWTSHLGLLVGVRMIPARGNTPSSITPVMAINYFR